MNSTKKRETIADRINDALKPKELIEDGDENEARFEIFDEHVKNSQISDIRKQNTKNLGEIDSKYKGKVANRKEIEKEYEGSSSNEESEDLVDESESEEEPADLSDKSEESDDDLLDESDANEEDSEDDASDMSGSDEYDISQFIAKESSSKITKSEPEESTTLVSSKKSISDEVKKGICVQNQLKMWEKLLEVRIKAQKMLITANSFPNFDSFLELTEIEDSEFSEKAENACDGIYNLLDNLLELQSTLCERFPESSNLLKSSKRKGDDTNGSIMMKKSKLSGYADKIEANNESYSKFRNQVLQKWHDRTKSLKDSKNPATNLNIITKIENALLGKNEVIRKSQIYRGDYEIYGLEAPKNDSEEIQIPEIFDDSDFYHQLLRELIEYKSNFGDNQSEITQKFIELQNVRSKMKKRVETRTSKGRKIRYNVHNKLVNFMPPKDNSEWTEEAKTELFSSLFGKLSA